MTGRRPDGDRDGQSDATEPRARVRSAVGELKDAVAKPSGGARRVAAQLARVNVLDTATRLAAQVFLAALPVLFVVVSFGPPVVRDELLSSLRASLGLTGASADQARQFTTGEPPPRESWGVFSILMTLLSATAVSRTLQRLCERAWHLPPTGGRLAAWRWLLWLFGWLASLVFHGACRDGFGAGPLVGFPLALSTTVLMWWWTQHLLLGKRVPWGPLLPGALLTGCGIAVCYAVSRLYLPRALNESIHRYGPVGSVFTLLSWLIVLFVVVTLGIALGYLLAQQAPFDRWLGPRQDGSARTRPSRTALPRARKSRSFWSAYASANCASARSKASPPPEVGGDGDPVAGAGVRTGQGGAADVRRRAPCPPAHRVDAGDALPVAQLAYVEVALAAVDACGPLPAEEDVAGGLHQPLAGHDPFALVACSRSGPAYWARTEGSASLACSSSGSPPSRPSSRTIQQRVPTLPTPTTLRAMSTTRYWSSRAGGRTAGCRP